VTNAILNVNEIMRGVFHGWRRKTGVVTLVLACLCMGGWMRSTWVVNELLCVTDSQTLHAVYTCPIGIGWSRLHETVFVSGFAPHLVFDRWSWAHSI